MRYTVTFIGGRIGRRHELAPIIVEVPDDARSAANEISERVYYFSRNFLASSMVDVVTNLGEDAHLGGTGTVFAGHQVGATFTVEPVREGTSA